MKDPHTHTLCQIDGNKKTVLEAIHGFCEEMFDDKREVDPASIAGNAFSSNGLSFSLIDGRDTYKLVYRNDMKAFEFFKEYAGFDEDDENKPLVIARDGEQLDILTYRDDPKAGYIGWRIHWDGDEHHAPSDGDAPAVYFLVETCSQQYSEECGAPTYGTQAWRIEQGKVTHDAWFECGKDDPINAVKELYDIYDDEFTIDIDALRVVESENNHYFHLVY